MSFWLTLSRPFWSQVYVFGQPELTEKNLPDQHGRVALITGANSGCGYALADIMYSKNATVYIACRNEAKGLKAIESIKQGHPDSKGQLHLLILDVSDLSTIFPAVQSFLNSSNRLDLLWNNAGIGECPKGSLSAQGHELIMATNCLGAYLLTSLLLPTLEETSAKSAPNSVRVIWTSSIMVDSHSPKGGVDVKDLNAPTTDPRKNYGMSKAGNYFLAQLFPRHNPSSKVVHLTQNPGNLRTNIWIQAGNLIKMAIQPILYPVKYGAYTMLWAGCSEKIDIQQHQGGYVVPWGKWHSNIRPDIQKSLKAADGDTSVAEKFWAWCDDKTKAFR